MCGICGVIDYNRAGNIDEALIRRMCQELKHRGPDDEGVYLKRNGVKVGLGHRRLSIIDLSASGHQPMPNEDKTVWLVFNGEVYNYKDLRIELEAKGHIFLSNTDSETIIHLYEEYGEDCLKYMRGMFAFAIWDEAKQILFAARDRVGKKPFIYTYNNGRFIFASEFAALLASGLIDNEVNPEAIHYYLTFGYIPAPMTIYKSVFKLPHAHTLVLQEGRITVKQYWKLDYHNKLNISEEEATEEIIRLVKEAIEIRLYSDVPLGAFLSGGIDSSTIVALMNEVSNRTVKTFSIGFDDQDYSELKFARNIARRYNTDHHELIVKPDAIQILPLLVERYGEPYADSSCIPTYYVAKQTKEYVTVALNGDGGDESFAGYERYQAMIAAEIYQKLPQAARGIIKGFAKMLPDSVSSKDKLRRIKRFIEAVALPVPQRYTRWVGVFSEDMQKNIYSEEFKGNLRYIKPSGLIAKYLADSDGLDLLDRLLQTDINTNLADDLMVKADIATMANSLEARSPFLDQKVMEFMAKLPPNYKMRSFIKKYILKKAIKDLVPKENINRGKMGFGIPVGKWFRNELKDLLCQTLLSASFLKRGYFKPHIINNIVGDHIDGRKDYTFALWTLLMLELWHRRFID